MRLVLALMLGLLLPSVSFAQTEESIKDIEKKIANLRTVKWILTQEAPNGGFYLAPQDPNVDAAPRPSLRATSAAVRSLKYLDFPLLKKEREKHAAFVLSCYDPKTGGFAEPGGKPDVTLTSIGVMAAVELDIPKEKFAKAMDYLKEHAKTFEDVRIGAAAVEAWGVKDCPFKLDEWSVVALKHAKDVWQKLDPQDGGGREVGSLMAMALRLSGKVPEKNWDDQGRPALVEGQLADGGWKKKGEKASDIETTYRVMRALMLLKEKPKDAKKLREFIESHRNQDHGYAMKPGDKSSMGGVYYSIIISKWLDEMEAAKK